MSREMTIKLVMSWPGVLNIVNLTAALMKIESSLSKLQFPIDDKFMGKLITTVPRVIVQDAYLAKKYDILVKTYPDLNVRKAMIDNPRLFTQKLETIDGRFKVSC